MGYGLLILYLLLTYVRPADLVRELAPYRIMLIVGIVALVASIVGLFTGRGPTFRSRQMYVVPVFAVWAALTVMLEGWLGGGLDALLFFSPTVILFFLVVLNLDSLPRFRHVAALIVALTLIPTGQGIAAYHFGFQEKLFVLVENVVVSEEAALEATDGTDPGEDATAVPRVRRIRGLGFVNDPNDLAQAIVSVLPFLLMLWRRGRMLRNGLIVVLPGAILLYGIYLTKSRGAQLAFLVLLFATFQRRLGKSLSLVLSGLGLALIMAVSIGGRAIAVDESASERVEAWYLGLELLKSHPIWGVGFYQFDEYSTLVAHNSFVHCFAELGLVGYFVWLMMVVGPLVELWQMERLDASSDDSQLAEWARATRLGLIAFLAAAFFLSRTYSVMLFILLGLAAAIADVARKKGLQARAMPLYALGGLVAMVEALSIVVIYMVIRLIPT